jgi:two-component SAPR family response regulator
LNKIKQQKKQIEDSYFDKKLSVIDTIDDIKELINIIQSSYNAKREFDKTEDKEDRHELLFDNTEYILCNYHENIEF